MTYSLHEQLNDAQEDLVDDQYVLDLAERELEEAVKWVDSRKKVVAEGKLRVAKLKRELGLVEKDENDQRDNEQNL